jgi:hypothetical protein
MNLRLKNGPLVEEVAIVWHGYKLDRECCSQINKSRWGLFWFREEINRKTILLKTMTAQNP